MSYKVIDLFCGCGGLSYGFDIVGFDIVIGIDNWLDALKTFSQTHQNAIAHYGDLFTLKPNEIADKYQINQVDVIVGGPPCQGFSIAGKRMIDDERNILYKGFVNFVSFYRPSAFVMENVPNLISMGKGSIKQQIIEDFEKLGYKVSSKILIASDYGVPQNRKRAIFVGLLNRKEFQFPIPFAGSKITSSEAISDLPEESLEDGANYISEPKSEFQKIIRSDSDGIFNHQITNHSEQTISIISQVPDGGNFKNLPSELQQTRNVNIAWTRLNSQKPSFTIDTGHRHHFHYKYNRIPTVRESARIQSFPDKFVFLGTKTSQYKQVGNAVPPLLGKVIAESLLKTL